MFFSSFFFSIYSNKSFLSSLPHTSSSSCLITLKVTQGRTRTGEDPRRLLGHLLLYIHSHLPLCWDMINIWFCFSHLLFPQAEEETNRALMSVSLLSSILMINCSGPNNELCGTPLATQPRSALVSLICTLCLLLFKTLPFAPWDCDVNNSRW